MITGGRVYPVRHYPVAIRLRDRKGRAILCIALILKVGTFRAQYSKCHQGTSSLNKSTIYIKDIDRIVVQRL